jgi:hypothetical protein
LSQRRAHAFRILLDRHAIAVIIGADCPLLPPRLLRQACWELRAGDAVLGSCPDGGFYLISLRRFRPGMLAGVRWGTAHAFRDTPRRLRECAICSSILPPSPTWTSLKTYCGCRARCGTIRERGAGCRRRWRFLKNLS